MANKVNLSSYPWKAIVIGALLSILVALYSAYAGLKIGGVYWPMVTTAVVCLALARLLGGKNIHETNVMQTTASTGGLLAAGIIFTIPALYMLGLQVSATDILFVSLAGGILGLLFVYPLRQRMIAEEKLPYADGAAAAAILQAGDKGGKTSSKLFAAFGVGAIFAIARDVLTLFPAYFNLESLKISAAKLFSFGSAISLIPLAGGYLIGTRFTAAWFAGAVATYLLIVPYVVSTGLFPDKLAVLVNIAKPLGVGMVIGAALAYFLTKGLGAFNQTIKHFRTGGMGKKIGFVLAIMLILLTYVFELSLPLALLAIIGAFLMAFVGARITGEMNVDPMEIFALIILLAAKFFFGFGVLHLALLAAVVCIAAGIAGDSMQDFKTGHLLGTPPAHQLAGEVAGVVSASLVMGLLMMAFASKGFGGIDFPAPQAVAIKEILQATSLSSTLLAGMLAGFALTLVAMRAGLGAVAIAFGIGLYVPIELSVPLFIGGLIRYAVDKRKQTELWRLVAGGVIAGEGLVGAIIVLISAKAFLGF